MLKEVEEPFEKDQIGSSAMVCLPQRFLKRNMFVKAVLIGAGIQEKPHAI